MMEARACWLMAALLLPPLAAPAPASPADRDNIALRKQIAAPEVLLRATVRPGEATHSLDVADTTQALVCSQIFGVLPYRTFHRQRFDSFTTCTCVSQLTATCEPDTFYPTVAPGTPEAALAQEHSSVGSDKFIEMLNAFSVQQTCFFEHLRGLKLSPPRPCAFSWAQGERPACDCAQPPVVPITPEPEPEPETETEEGTPTVQPEPQPTPGTPEATPQAPEVTDPVTERSTKTAVQSVIRSGEAPSRALQAAAVQVVQDELTASAQALKVPEGQRRPLVTESAHLRRVRSQPGH